MGWKKRSPILGTESNTEKEKAKHLTVLGVHALTGVSVGVIIRTFYSIINLQKNEWCPGKDGKPKSNVRFTVKEIEYDENRNT